MGHANLAVSLTRLFDEVNRAYPKRDHASDGWLGDASHAARPSDHNPTFPRPPGWVHAADIDATVSSGMGSGPVGDRVCAAALRIARGTLPHPINYIIYKGRIYSRTYGFRARTYNGANKHYSHVHISIIRTSWARAWRTPWGIAVARKRIIAHSTIKAFSGHPLASPVSVSRVQRRLVAWQWLKPGGYTPGRVDARTKAAFIGWQGKRGYPVTGKPTIPQLVRLAGTVYRVVP